MTQLAVGPQTRVTLHFALKLDDGSVVDSTFDKEPATFEFGDGNLLPGFEKALVGLMAGEKSTLTIAPEDAFSQPNPNNIQTFKRSDFDVEMVLEPGLVISFADPSGELPGVVKSVDGDVVTVDFNHPLAGREIQFDVEIISVEQQEQSDLAHPAN